MRNLICFTGGGTTGHVAPGCAVIENLRTKSDFSYLWIGSNAENEKHILERFAVPYISIPAGKMRRYFSLRNFSDLFKILFGFIKSLFILLRQRPLLIFSKGGYVSFPPLLAARLLRIPVISHESDAIPGLATKLNSGLSDTILLGFASAASCFPEKTRPKLIVCGNPVRNEIYSGSAKNVFDKYHFSSKKPVLLVMGGSQGAKQLNDLLAANLETLLKDLIIIHQCGKTFTQPLSHPDYICSPFFNEDYCDMLASADIVVSRGGASSLFEIAALKKPSILIPLSTGASRGDQIKNVKIFTDLDAALSLDNPDEKEFLDTVTNLYKDASLRKRLSGNLSKIVDKDPAENISEIILSMIKKGEADNK